MSLLLLYQVGAEYVSASSRSYKENKRNRVSWIRGKKMATKEETNSRSTVSRCQSTGQTVHVQGNGGAFYLGTWGVLPILLIRRVVHMGQELLVAPELLRLAANRAEVQASAVLASEALRDEVAAVHRKHVAVVVRVRVVHAARRLAADLGEGSHACHGHASTHKHGACREQEHKTAMSSMPTPKAGSVAPSMQIT